MDFDHTSESWNNEFYDAVAENERSSFFDEAFGKLIVETLKGPSFS
jgi:hypothetical protein